MAVPTLKTECFALTTTLTTTLLTAGSGQTIRVLHITASCGASGGSITLSKVDTSKSVTANIWNAKAIPANSNLEYFDTLLESGDMLKGGYTSATNVHMILDYQVLQS